MPSSIVKRQPEEWEVEKVLKRRARGGKVSIIFCVYFYSFLQIIHLFPNYFKKVEYLLKWLGYDTSQNSWEKETNMSCPDVLLDFRFENGHGRRIIAVRMIGCEPNYRMQWGDGSYSTLVSRDVQRHWSRLLFDFLVGKIEWCIVAANANTENANQPIVNSNQTTGNAIKAICKCNFLF